MRFCPWCSAENASDAASCTACGRRLPPLPTRKQRPAGAPPTGMISTPTPTTNDDERRRLRNSLLPAPSALRRRGPTGEVRPSGADARRHDDVTARGDEPDEGTRPIDASWLIESTGSDPEIDTPLAPPP